MELVGEDWSGVEGTTRSSPNIVETYPNQTSRTDS